MKLLKPLWLKHGGEKKDFEVYSCHVSADAKRLVTAAGDGYVRIWSTEAIYNSANAKPDVKLPTQLAALSYHSGTIHAVRFSGNNKYLASGADDKIVCVYVLDPTAAAHTSFGSNEAAPVENWRIYRRLIGHENDVQDLGWSCDSSILVSVGLDSRIVVWSGSTFEKLKTLSQHGSHVKGITFDPANKYFATASDDRSIKIFRYTPPAPNATSYDQTNNFMLECSVIAPFVTSPLTTYFRRCSWSPDGNHIAGANAVNGPVSTAVIIERGTWDCNINLIGHEGPVEVCAFSPRIFSKTPINPPDQDNQDSQKRSEVTVIACAGQDRALSIWNTTSSKPLCVNENLCTKSISDLAWSPDGESVFFTSLDGTIALARFAKGELGYPVPLEVNESSLAKYGAGRKVGVVEGPDALILEEKSKTDELKNVQGRMGELMGEDKAGNKSSPLDLTNGIHINGASNGSVEKLTNGNLTNAQNSNNAAPAATNGEVAVPPQPISEDTNAAKVERLKQKVTITKDGKKRVAPLLVSTSAGTNQSSLPTARLLSNTSQSQRTDGPQEILDMSKPYDGLPKGGLAGLLFGNKRKLAETGGEEDNVISHRVKTTEREGGTAVLANTADGLALPGSDKASGRPPIINPSLMYSALRLAVPTLRPQITRPLNLLKDITGEDGHTLDVKNPVGPSRTGRVQDKEPTRLTVSKRGQVLWQDFLPKAVTLVTGNNRFWAATTEDGSLYVWSPAGRRLFNAIILEAQAVILDSRGPFLFCVTAVGLCHVWNVEAVSSPHPPVSISTILDIAASSQGPHLTNSPSIVFARLNSDGRIVVAMSNGDAFTYSSSMYSWMRLSEAWWAVGSQYWNSSDAAQTLPNRNTDPEENDVVKTENISAGIIPLLERNTTSQTLLRGRAYFLQRLVKALLSAEGYEGFETGVSIAHLENRLAAALTLGAREEFKLYLSMYAKRLGAESSRLKIEELLRTLVQGIDSGDDAGVDGASNKVAPSYIAGIGRTTNLLCGWKRELLLKEVVLILGKYRDLQRITVPYARLLGITNLELASASIAASNSNSAANAVAAAAALIVGEDGANDQRDGSLIGTARTGMATGAGTDTDAPTDVVMT